MSEYKKSKSLKRENREPHLSSLEQETIILYNEAEKTANVYTCNKALKLRLDRYCEEYPELYKHVTREPQDKYGKFYEMPKRYVRIGKPTKRKGNIENLTRNTKFNFKL